MASAGVDAAGIDFMGVTLDGFVSEFVVEVCWSRIVRTCAAV